MSWGAISLRVEAEIRKGLMPIPPQTYRSSSQLDLQANSATDVATDTDQFMTLMSFAPFDGQTTT